MSSDAQPDALRSPLRSQGRVRGLTASDLHIAPRPLSAVGQLPLSIEEDLGIQGDLLDVRITDDDPRLVLVRELLAMGYAGVIFTGPPGTSKSWYAAQIGASLVDRDPTRLRFVQFHASYQYEDFVEGFVPWEGGFDLRPKHLLEMCTTAEDVAPKPCVIVIDEMSRCDPSRVFGEALTYIETSRRNQNFSLASGTETSIPDNLLFIGTMNPEDRAVDELDAAVERRFAKIEMRPDAAILDNLLSANGVSDDLRQRVGAFFRWLLKNQPRQSWIGHAYFRLVRNEDGLNRLWEHQLRFHFERVFRLDAEALRAVEERWKNIFLAAAAPATTQPS